MKRSSLWKNVVTLLTLASTTTAYIVSTSRRTDNSSNRVHSIHRLNLTPNKLSNDEPKHLQTSERFTKRISHTLKLSNVNNNNNNEPANTEMETKELGIWAARGILLVVAAVWGTNFAVCIMLVRFLGYTFRCIPPLYFCNSC